MRVGVLALICCRSGPHFTEGVSYIVKDAMFRPLASCIACPGPVRMKKIYQITVGQLKNIALKKYCFL